MTGYTVNDGNGGNDYTVTTETAPGTITPAALTITAATDTKIYDGTIISEMMPTTSELYDGDTATGLTQEFESKDALGTNGSTLEVTGYTIDDGNDGDNYTVTTKTATGTIIPAALSITADSSSKVYGQTVTFTGTEFSDSGLIGEDTVTSVILTSAGAAAAAPASGSPYEIVPSAAVGHDLNNYTITYIDGSLTVRAMTQQGAVNSSLPQTFYAENVVLTATFSSLPSGSTPMTGTVAFYDGTTYLGTAPLVTMSPSVVDLLAISPAVDNAAVSGQASLPTSSLSVGSHVITAVYSGDANYTGATSNNPATIQVAPATTSTTLSSATSAQGTVLTATITVTSPGNPRIAGNVSFYDGTTLLGTEPLENGVASLNIGTPSADSHNFSAVFASSDGTLSSSSSTLPATDGPRVTSVVRYGFRAQSTFLVIQFNGALDVTSARNVSNYMIVGPGGHRFKVGRAVYDPTTQTVTLKPVHRLSLHRTYRLTINGAAPSGVSNPAGLPLDGAATGKPGSNHVTTLTWRNLAGSARQLPTRGLLHAAFEPAPSDEVARHKATARLHAAAVDHLLKTEALDVAGRRLGARRDKVG